MTGRRLVVGVVVMGILLPLSLFMLLELHALSELFTLSAAIFLCWGVADLFATIIERPRLRDKSPADALRRHGPESGSQGT